MSPGNRRTSPEKKVLQSSASETNRVLRRLLFRECVFMRRIVTKVSKSSRIAGWLHPPPYIMNPELKKSGIEEALFVNWTEPPWGTGRIDHEEEVLRFKQLHFCAYRLSRLYQSAVKSYRPAIHKDYAKWVNRYHAIR